MATLCGTKPSIFGFSDGYGGNTWHKIAPAELEGELSRSHVMRFIYSNANDDPQKASSDLNSMTAEGRSALIADPEFGPSQIPSVRSALKADITVVAYPGSASQDADLSSSIVAAA